MSQSRLVTGALNKRARNAGTYIFGPVILPASVKAVSFEIERDSWPVSSDANPDVLTAILEYSPDFTTPLRELARATFVGGDAFSPDPNDDNAPRILAPASFLTVEFPDVGNPSRVVAGSLILRERLNLSVNIDVIE